MSILLRTTLYMAGSGMGFEADPHSAWLLYHYGAWALILVDILVYGVIILMLTTCYLRIKWMKSHQSIIPLGSLCVIFVTDALLMRQTLTTFMDMTGDVMGLLTGVNPVIKYSI